MNKKKIGLLNEKLAQKYLKEKGYQILHTNFYCKFGEIDIICKDRNCIVFIEVRSRKNSDFGLPEETVNTQKQQKIIKTAEYFLEKSSVDFDEIRFDVISILEEKIKHIENAFEV